MDIRCNIRGERDVPRMRREQERNTMFPRRRMRWIWPLVIVLFVAVPVLTACDQASGDGSLPSGWSWYDASRFAFHVPVPPKWRTGTFDSSEGTSGCDAYHVDLFPPSSHGSPGVSAEEYEPLLMSILVDVSCPPWRGTQDDQYFIAEPHPVTISGVQATLYDNGNVGSSVERDAVAEFGGHQYQFGMRSYVTFQDRPSKAQQNQELALYMQILQGFRYTGK